MSVPSLRVLGFVMISASLAVGCSSPSKIDLGGTCILNSDCNGTLVCTMGKCHDACHTSADCPTGQSCVKTSDTTICQLPAEASCSGTSSCDNGLSCAPDQHCRTGCLSVANCTPGQVCASNFCADPNDPNLVNGQFPPKVGADAGTYDAASPDLQVVVPADAFSTVTGPEAGVTYDALDASASPDAPAAPLDVAASPPDASEAGPVVGVQDASPDLGASPSDAPGSVLACTSGCDDGLSCTTDTCVVGVCQSTLKSGYCLIDKVCYMDGDTKPGDACQACTITTSTSLWTPEPEGAPCGTGKSCQSHVCTACGAVGQACCGTAIPGTCSVGAACDSGTKTCKVDKAIDISGGGNTFCALFQSGHVRCWGGSGTELGISNSSGSNVALPPVVGLDDAVQVSVGSQGTCAVRATGAVICWGNPVGTASTYTPVAVAGISNATQVSVGYEHACVRTADTKILCWGSNSNGQFGNGLTNTSSTTPMQMSNVGDARKVAACGWATCVLGTGGQVACAGMSYENGQVTDVSTATNVPTVSDPIDLSCSAGYAYGGYFCAVGQAGTLSCWGRDTSAGQPYAPSTVASVGQVLAAVGNASGSLFYLAIQQDHSLWALGYNDAGQLGDGTFTTATYRTSPRLAHVSAALGGVVAVAIRNRSTVASSCLLRDDGSVSCAGGGTALGDGQSQLAANRTPFVPVVGILPVASEDGQCFDGVDNDGNGKTDLDDPACAQDLGSATGNNVATVQFAGIFGNYLGESCNTSTYGPGNFGGPEAVLTWTAPSGGTYQFDTSGSSFDTVLAAYKGNPQTAAELACNDDGATLLNGASAIQVQVITGDKLTLVVDSKAAPTTQASFTLNITKQ
jgi:Regulator of chromosome condensation (RCC1) repeat